MKTNSPINILERAKSNVLPIIYTLFIIAIGIAILLLGLLFAKGPPKIPADESFFDLRVFLSGLNIILVIFLLFTYIKDYILTKASFTIGIIAFLFVFLLYGLSSFPFIHILFGYPLRGMGGVGIFSFMPMFFTTIALLIFIKISRT